ncbi:MAG: nicotinate phosphoribosyltransferase [Alphaproteobacteria bacterium]|nr:nicotinate phosphoribosyltransferase [Alphaproteobacteria bacterium]
MQLSPIITSLLETDMYKFSMGQAIYHMFPSYTTTWTFKCRNIDVFFTSDMVQEIAEQIKAFCDLRFSEQELDYLKSIKWLKESYIDFLRIWRPRFEDFNITTYSDCGLSIEANGTWLNTSMYEIPVLAIVNEVYFRYQYDYDLLKTQFQRKLNQKIDNLKNGKFKIGCFSEFGLRRRLSSETQNILIQSLKDNSKDFSDSSFVGTSNVYLAYKNKILPVGTMAHEWIMCVGQGCHKHNPAYSNWYSLNSWVKEYGVLNGIALTDAITTDCFLRDFQLTFATLFSGVRHDSGDPIAWGDKIISHYKSLGINPLTKTLLFSDSLDFERAHTIRKYFGNKTKVAFGIGTYLSNDTDVSPLNIVMKTTNCNKMDVAKISDIEGKSVCKNPDYIHYLKRCIDYRMKNQID